MGSIRRVESVTHGDVVSYGGDREDEIRQEHRSNRERRRDTSQVKQELRGARPSLVPMMDLQGFGGLSVGAGRSKGGHCARTHKQRMAQTCIVPGTCITLFVFGLAAYAQNVQTPGTDDKGQTQRDARDRNLYGSDNAADRSTTRKLISNVWLDQKDIWTSPFRMHRSNAKWWVLVGAGTGAFIATDHIISRQLPNSGTSIRCRHSGKSRGAILCCVPVCRWTLWSRSSVKQPASSRDGGTGRSSIVGCRHCLQRAEVGKR
jgi:hypothetical protein